MRSPATRQLGEAMRRPDVAVLPPEPPNSSMGMRAFSSVFDKLYWAPGWLYPLMITGSVMSGRVLMTLMVVKLPGMLKSISSWPRLALAARMALRNEPAPLSLVLVTVNHVRTRRSSRASTEGRKEQERRAGRDCCRRVRENAEKVMG